MPCASVLPSTAKQRRDFGILRLEMPELCRFLGIIIAMYHREHGVAHFHVTYGEHDATIDIETGEVLAGKLPRRILKKVREWREIHLEELRENAELAAMRRPLNKIEPLE